MSELNSRLVNYSLYLLGRRDYSTKEMIKKFKEKEYLDSDIEAVMHYIQENNYQSDERFTRSYINSKLASKVGLSKIKSQLVFEKGINKELLENVLAEYAEGELDELDTILRILQTKYRNKDLKDHKEKSKAFRFLVSKGFSFDDIKRALAVEPDE